MQRTAENVKIIIIGARKSSGNSSPYGQFNCSWHVNVLEMSVIDDRTAQLIDQQ